MKKMWFKFVIGMAAVMSAEQAQAGFMSLLVTGATGNGNAGIYTLNTTTGAAVFNTSAQDPPTLENNFSPNALGLSGSDFYYTTFDQSGNETLYRNNTSILSLVTTPDSIAAGDAFGTNYYYVDRYNGKLNKVSDIAGTPTRSEVGTLLNPAASLGDLAILDDGSTAIISYGNGMLSLFDLNSASISLTDNTNNWRYVGLGLASDGNLYGVRRVGANDFDLYMIDTTTLAATFVNDITGILSGYEITDAARAPDDTDITEIVPAPPALVLALLGVPAFGLVRRISRNKGQVPTA